MEQHGAERDEAWRDSFTAKPGPAGAAFLAVAVRNAAGGPEMVAHRGLLS
jgi:hypothetical protein